MKQITHHIIALMAVALLGILSQACSDTVYDSLPDPLSQFVSQYYPGANVSSYTSSDGIYTVVVTDGPTIKFNKDYQWISIDAEGNTVPEMFLYDRLPPALYEYLQSTQSLHSVYSASRDSKQYHLTLLDSSLTYDIDTAQITSNLGEGQNK